MGRSTKWIGEDLKNLLELSVEELCKLYPSEAKRNLRSIKRYHTRKAQMEAEGRLYKTWEVSAFNTQTQEWETTTNHGYEYGNNPEELAETFEPVEPAKITPTKRKRAERLGKQILVFGDSQIGYHRVYDEEGNDELIPTHSEEVLSVINQINAHERPEIVVNLSDTWDAAELGRFDPSSDSLHRTITPALRRIHDFYAQMRSDNPDSDIYEVDSNHTTRVHKAIMKKMPELYGVVLPGERYPLMSYYRLANLEPLNINFISGYGAAEYVHGEEYDAPPIVFKHGTHASNSPGSTIRKEMNQNPSVHVVRGHGHSYEAAAQTTRDGHQLHYYQLGTSCDNKGSVPSYHSAMDDFGHPVHHQENWQNQIMVIEDFENGHYNFNVLDVVDGIAYYKGMRYDGNQQA